MAYSLGLLVAEADLDSDFDVVGLAMIHISEWLIKTLGFHIRFCELRRR